ncbi:MAG: PDZ domain-containing protein [Sorangiineae bacterium]|nr:PDZ domain-containing protein [Polyangiaceae bacterium]MEB2321363.1 PDZ domain-containing protein [Sorangiineae bacterium]
MSALVSSTRRRASAILCSALLGAAGSLGCGAVYPEVATPIVSVPADRLEPRPPADLVFVTFASASIPGRTRDGRKWDAVGGSAPDPFAVLFVDDREIIRTPVQANTLAPTWPDQVKANYRIGPRARTRVELWDSNALTDHPICVKEVSGLQGAATAGGELDILCDSGARVKLQVEPAHGRFGLGLYYELRTTRVFVTRVVADSPAGRVKLEGGDEIVRVQGKSVKSLKQRELRTLIATNAAAGVSLTVKRKDQRVEDVTLRSGAIYPTLADGIPVE